MTPAARKSPGLLLPKSFVSRTIFSAVMERKRRAKELKRKATDLIQAAYPEHLFHLEVNEETGDILIDHPLLAHAKGRYFCSYATYEQSGGQAVVKLAGEVLERANVRRGELMFFEEYDGEADRLARTQFSAR